MSDPFGRAFVALAQARAERDADLKAWDLLAELVATTVGKLHVAEAARDRLAKENIALRADLDRLAAEVEAAAEHRSADLGAVEAQCAANLDRKEAAEAGRERLTAQIQRARALHRPVTAAGLTPSSRPYCVVCKVPAPCDTVAALDES
jgi:hypothetical protein